MGYYEPNKIKSAIKYKYILSFLTMKNNLGFSINDRETRLGYGGSVIGQDGDWQLMLHC